MQKSTGILLSYNLNLKLPLLILISEHNFQHNRFDFRALLKSIIGNFKSIVDSSQRCSGMWKVIFSQYSVLEYSHDVKRYIQNTSYKTRDIQLALVIILGAYHSISAIHGWKWVRWHRMFEFFILGYLGLWIDNNYMDDTGL